MFQKNKFFLITFCLIITFLSCEKEENHINRKEIFSKITNFSIQGNNINGKKLFLLKSKIAKEKKNLVFITNPNFIIFEKEKEDIIFNSEKALYNKEKKTIFFNNMNLNRTNLTIKAKELNFEQKKEKISSKKTDIKYFDNKILGDNFESDIKLKNIKLNKVKAILNY
ncbi:MAG: LPS export ABC transporter periplasmic protein LptC [Cyanobacteriota bacterium]